MKKSEILISLLVFCTFFVIGCLKVGTEHPSQSMDARGPKAPVTIWRDQKIIKAAVSSLHQKYEMRFYVKSTSPFAYKLKVEDRGNIERMVEDFERVELDGDKYLSGLSEVDRGSSFNRKLSEKMKAIRDFLDNYPNDNSYFLASSGKCPNISGTYKKNKEDGTIKIKSKGCRTFEVSRNKTLQGPVIKLEENRNCRGGKDYWLCSKGIKLPSNHIEFLFVEKWDKQSCTKENWLRVDEKGILVSKIRQTCKGAEPTVFEERYFKLMAAN
jgi:hypothetical protein